VAEQPKLEVVPPRKGNTASGLYTE